MTLLFGKLARWFITSSSCPCWGSCFAIHGPWAFFWGHVGRITIRLRRWCRAYRIGGGVRLHSARRICRWTSFWILDSVGRRLSWPYSTAFAGWITLHLDMRTAWRRCTRSGFCMNGGSSRSRALICLEILSYPTFCQWDARTSHCRPRNRNQSHMELSYSDEIFFSWELGQRAMAFCRD